MPEPQKVPNALVEKFASVTAATDASCAKHLNNEYRDLVRQVVGALARKRPSRLPMGKENVWAAAAVHAVGRVNFLDDASQTPHCQWKVIWDFFGVAQTTGNTKSREIRDILKMDALSPQWTLPSRAADNPIVWMLQVDGLMMDMRQAPIEMQQLAFDKGLIPFVPALGPREPP